MAKKITVHVLSGAGMGASVAWQDESNELPKPGYKQNYIQSVQAVLNGITGLYFTAMVSTKLSSFLPGYHAMKAMGYAVDEFPAHTTDMLNKERERIETGDSVSRSNIMSQLLQASEQPAGTDSKVDERREKALSDEEMMGNLFVFTAAALIRQPIRCHSLLSCSQDIPNGKTGCSKKLMTSSIRLD